MSEDTYKITIEILNDKVAQEIADKFPQCRMLAFTGENYYRFASKNSSKINAIRETAKSLNIDMSQVVAFGDDYNDFEMIIETTSLLCIHSLIRLSDTFEDSIHL